MKDEEMAEEYTRRKCPMPFNWNEIDVARRSGYKDGFLAGLKAGRPQWNYMKWETHL